jgi:hypothetical protein
MKTNRNLSNVMKRKESGQVYSTMKSGVPVAPASRRLFGVAFVAAAFQAGDFTYVRKASLCGVALGCRPPRQPAAAMKGSQVDGKSSLGDRSGSQRVALGKSGKCVGLFYPERSQRAGPRKKPRTSAGLSPPLFEGWLLHLSVSGSAVLRFEARSRRLQAGRSGISIRVRIGG